MPGPYCEHCDLPLDFCVHGRPSQPQQNTMIQDNRGPAFPAKFGGTCTSCGDRIEPGDMIRADGEGGWECDGHD